jgi:hypothetical protein
MPQAQITFHVSYRDSNYEPVQRLAYRMYEMWQAARLAGDFTGTGLHTMSPPQISYGSEIEVDLNHTHVVLVVVRGKIIAEITEKDGSYVAYLGPEFEEVETGAEWNEG